MRGGEDVSCKKAKVKIQKLKSLKDIHAFLVDSNFIVSKVGQANGKDVGVGPKVDRSCYSDVRPTFHGPTDIGDKLGRAQLNFPSGNLLVDSIEEMELFRPSFFSILNIDTHSKGKLVMSTSSSSVVSSERFSAGSILC